MRTQNQMILDWLKEGKTLTQLVALGMFNCMRLASRINDLRNDGHDILTIWRDLPNGKRIGEYKLIKLARRS